MSIIVKGIKMPENCFECPCCRHDSTNGFQNEQCNLTLDVFDAGYYERFEGRAQNCPLVALPDKHGRLVDADELKTAFPCCDNNMNIKIASVRATINHMDTIVDAEDSE